MNIADIRREYALKALLENEVPDEPIDLFRQWWEEALHAEISEPNAMILSTVMSDNTPSARVVLMKGFSNGGFIFFTNYNSCKGRELAGNPKASLVFFWKELERQVRITGIAEKISAKESDEYFLSRPEMSRIGAYASPQSQVIESRQWLDNHFENLSKQMGGSKIQRPPYWGGYLVKPAMIEFWQGRPGRLHDRIRYIMEDEDVWKRERLAP